MIRTQIQLEEEQYRRLRVLGAKSGLGLARQVREAVDLYLARHARVAEPLAEVAGRFPPLPTGCLKQHDRDYTDSIR